MIKRITLAHKSANLTTEEFAAYWTGPHAELASSILSCLRGYVINVTDRERVPDAEFDGVAEFWFDSFEDLEAAFSGDALDQLIVDGDKFLGGVEHYDVAEHVVMQTG